jgi:integrase
VGAFLTHLARDRRLSASSQNQAMNAVVFLYRQVLAEELGPDHLGPIEAERVTRPAKVPTVRSADEVRRMIRAVPASSVHRPMVKLLYGCGLRLLECCTLRVRDLDFDRAQIIIREAKGGKDRVVMLPASASRRLRHRGGGTMCGRCVVLSRLGRLGSRWARVARSCSPRHSPRKSMR